MLKLTLESATYSETDFPRFNPDGFREVRTAVDLARMKRTIGMSIDDMREASRALEMAIDRKNAEQRIAIERFERDRQACFDGLTAITASIAKVRCSALRSCQLENLRDHAVTLYGMKDFDGVRRELAKLTVQVRDAVQPARPPASRQGGVPIAASASSQFYRGQSLERAGRLREAVEAYHGALAIDAHHVQAKAALARLVGRTAAGGAR